LIPGQAVTVAAHAPREIAGRRGLVVAVSAWDVVLKFDPPTSEGDLISLPLEQIVQPSAFSVRHEPGDSLREIEERLTRVIADVEHVITTLERAQPTWSWRRGSFPSIKDTGAGGGRFSPATDSQGVLTEQRRGSSAAGPVRGA